jgi:hypothetical protein
MKEVGEFPLLANESQSVFGGCISDVKMIYQVLRLESVNLYFSSLGWGPAGTTGDLQVYTCPFITAGRSRGH